MQDQPLNSGRWLRPNKTVRREFARRWIHRLRRRGPNLLIGALLHLAALPPIKAPLPKHRWVWRCERFCRRMLRDRARPSDPPRSPITRIELIGVPGVGKSTILQQLTQTGQFRRLPKVMTDDDLAAAASGAFPEFESVLNRIGRPTFWRRHNKSITTRMAMLQKASKLPPGPPLIEDEGLLQRGFNLAMFEPEHEVFFEYYWAVPAPDLVVVITAQPDRILARNKARGVDWPDKDRGAERFFLSWVADVAMLILTARGVSCAIIENDQTPGLGAARLREILAALRSKG